MKGTIVCDSSVIVKWISSQDELRIEQANKILNDAKISQVELYAPELAKYEVGNALLFRKKIASKNIKTSLAILYTLPIKYVAETYTQSHETYEIGEHSGITYYDASFMSLAKLLNATLVTDNPKHQAKVKGIKVIPLENYK